MVRKSAGRGLFRARFRGRFGVLSGGLGVALLAGLGQACSDAPTTYGAGALGPDTSPPVVQLAPSHDTTVDSTGVLGISVFAHDQSWVTSVQLVLVGGAFTYPPSRPDTTDADVGFTIALANFKHSQFRWFVRATDILNYTTVTDTVTVSVR